jgi:glycosyltransferase involved in cell wall biosynthesis
MNNTYIPKFTYIIPFRFRSDRILPLRRVIDLLAGFQGIEIIIVEQDKYSKISNLNLKATHIFIESDLPFNKSWAFNVAIKRASSPTIICADADFIMNPNELIESLKELENYDCVIPTSNIINLTQQESTADINSILNLKRIATKPFMTNGLTIFKKDALFRIAGWNEDFIGFGYENKFQDMKISNILNYKQMDYTGYHLYHNPEAIDTTLNQRSDSIMENYKDGDINKINNHIATSNPKIGAINKYTQVKSTYNY